MELVAAEPMVQSPVAAAFDADGNLYVAEMRDYPYKPKPGGRPLGTVRLLRDTDGDGRFDQSHVFADGLLWAAGIAPWQGGVFVSAPPDIWYLKDTNGDFQADVRKKVYTGFGIQNQQAMVNNLAWGLDHMVYGAAAGNGGTIRPADDPKAPGVSVERVDFRFDPMTGGFEPISGSDQFGNTFDDWGNRFTCDESHPLSQPVLPRQALARNPFLAVPSAVQDIAGGAVPIFRISPIERWRQIRSSRRIAHGTRSAGSAGASHHVVDAGAGVTVYRGGAYPLGILRQRLRGRRSEQPRPSAGLGPGRAHLPGDPRPSRAVDRVRPISRQLVPSGQLRERAGRYALCTGYEPRHHRGDPHPAGRAQALGLEARA